MGFIAATSVRHSATLSHVDHQAGPDKPAAKVNGWGGGPFIRTSNIIRVGEHASPPPLRRCYQGPGDKQPMSGSKENSQARNRLKLKFGQVEFYRCQELPAGPVFQCCQPRLIPGTSEGCSDSLSKRSDSRQRVRHASILRRGASFQTDPDGFRRSAEDASSHWSSAKYERREQIRINFSTEQAAAPGSGWQAGPDHGCSMGWMTGLRWPLFARCNPFC